MPPQLPSAPLTAWTPAATIPQPPAATTVLATTSAQPYSSAQQPAAAAGGRSAEPLRTSSSEQMSKVPEITVPVPTAAQVATFQAAMTAPLRTADIKSSSATSGLPAAAAAKAAPAVSAASLFASVSAAPAGMPASTAASVPLSGATSAASSVMTTAAAATAAAAASDAQYTLPNSSQPPLSLPASQQLSTQAAQANANPPSQPPTGPPSQSSTQTAAQDPVPSSRQTPAGPPQGWLSPNPAALSAVEPDTAPSGALPSAYATLPGKLTLSKSTSMQPRSVAMEATKIPLKVIRPQLPGMTKGSSPSIAGASTLIGEAKRQREANTASAPQFEPTGQRAQHSPPADSLPPSSSAGTAAAKPAANDSGLSEAAPGQNSTALGMQIGKPSSSAHVMHSDTTHPYPAVTTPGQPQDSPTPPAASDRLQRQVTTLSKGNSRPDGTGATAISSSPMPVGKDDGSNDRPMGGINGKRESPKGAEAVPGRSQSLAAEAGRGRKEGYSRARDRCEL